MFDPERDYVMETLQGKVEWLQDEAVRQLTLGNVDTAMHFANVAGEAQDIVFELNAMILKDPMVTSGDLKRYIKQLTIIDV